MDEKYVDGTKPWYERLAGFDFEVTKNDWLLVIIDYQTNERFFFHNDCHGVEVFIRTHDYIYVGYNCKHYDNYILKGILNHYTPEQIKDINDWIIIEHKNGWEYPFDDPYIKLPPTTDLMLDMLGISLKECEGNMCMDIQESTIDFNIDHKWTKEEFDEMLKYCIHDVVSTNRLIDERMGYLEAKVFNGTRAGLTPEESLYKTNGQLAAIALGAKKQKFNDERDIQYPSTVNWDNIPKEVIDFFNQCFDKKIDDKTLFNKKLKIHMLGLDWVFAWGGVHASVQCTIVEPESGYVFLIWDVTSLYPTIMEVYKLLSRAIPEPQKFSDMKYERVKAKHEGDKKTAGNLKVPINTVYGISLQEFNDCYDPRNGRSVCVTGQLLLTDLSVELCSQCKTVEMKNVNTDGIAFIIHESELEKAYAIKEEWENRVQCELEEGRIRRMVIKDINNYIMQNVDGSMEVKGGYVSDYPNGSFKHNSMSIVATAIVKYFTENIPVEDTILPCDDPFRFQLITKTGSSYNLGSIHYVDGKEVKVQKVNRVYAVADERYGVIKKGKKTYLTVDEDGERRYYINQKGKRSYKKKWDTDDGGDFFIQKDTAQNCPEHAYIDNSNTITIDSINKEWYINFAKKRINDFLGIEEKKSKGGKKKMATKKKEEETVVLSEQEARVQLYKKIFQVGEILSKMQWEFDGYNSNQDFEYIKSHSYRDRLGQACRQVGMVFKLSIGNQVFEKLEATKNMNLTTIYGNVSLIDVETGMAETYPIMAQGADNMDKGIYKAETMLIKYFVLNNFLLPQQSSEIDPESSENNAPVKVVEAKTPTVSREEAKEIVREKMATVEFLKEMQANIMKIRTVKPDYGDKMLPVLARAIRGDEPMTNKEAVKKMTKIEDRMGELGLE